MSRTRKFLLSVTCLLVLTPMLVAQIPHHRCDRRNRRRSVRRSDAGIDRNLDEQWDRRQ